MEHHSSTGGGDSALSQDPARDQAWVRVWTELSTGELLAFVQADCERLLRINSMYEVLSWQGAGRDAYVMRLRNLANGQTLETTVGATRTPDGLILRYGGGLKASTTFRVEARPDGTGADLIVSDDYSQVPAAERQARMAEVDNSLSWWGQDLFRYCGYLKRWAWVPGWLWYMERVWKPMKPAGRRIAYMLYVVTVVEIVAVIAAVITFGMGWDAFFR